MQQLVPAQQAAAPVTTAVRRSYIDALQLLLSKLTSSTEQQQQQQQFGSDDGWLVLAVALLTCTSAMRTTLCRAAVKPLMTASNSNGSNGSALPSQVCSASNMFPAVSLLSTCVWL
jgi:hypothetical protein